MAVFGFKANKCKQNVIIDRAHVTFPNLPANGMQYVNLPGILSSYPDLKNPCVIVTATTSETIGADGVQPGALQAFAYFLDDNDLLVVGVKNTSSAAIADVTVNFVLV